MTEKKCLSNNQITMLIIICPMNKIISDFIKDFLNEHFLELELPKRYNGDNISYRNDNERWLIAKLIGCVRYELQFGNEVVNTFDFGTKEYTCPTYIKDEIYIIIKNL